MKWNEGNPKKPGNYLVGIMNNWTNPEDPFIAAEVDEYLGDSIWRYHTGAVRYWSEFELLPDGNNISLSKDNSEKEIYFGCCSLLNELNEWFIELLDFYEIDNETICRDQFTMFTPEKIIRELFLSNTSHCGGTSTARKTVSVLGKKTEALLLKLNEADDE